MASICHRVLRQNVLMDCDIVDDRGFYEVQPKHKSHIENSKDLYSKITAVTTVSDNKN